MSDGVQAAGRGRSHVARLTFWLASGGFAIGSGEFAAMSLLPYYAHGFGVSETVAGHAVSIYAIGAIIGAPLFAVLAVKVPRKTALLGFMALIGIGYALAAAAPSMAALDVARFISGLPHGAYYGMAMLLAADMAGEEKRARAASHIMLGLAVANIVGVPLINVIGQFLGWRVGFGLVAGLAALTTLMVWRIAPHEPAPQDSAPLKELLALANRQVLLVLAMGAIGNGAAFAVYAYYSAAFLQTVHLPEWWVSVGLVTYGAGIVLGNWSAGHLAGRNVLYAAFGFQLLLSIATLAYAASIGSAPMMFAAMFLTGAGGGLVVPLQTRLMDVAGEGQTMAAAMNHAAFNAANALGPWLAGLVLAAGMGWQSAGVVGFALSMGGLLFWLAIMVTTTRGSRHHHRYAD
ncbi:MFS transporter [Roseibium sp. RKSG952]|uniref:MFS transporter n=1 Tax=Roseibium sp. RKSG952 TaxID=2529384 RepID=UPI0012BC810E|nr:MFS transporter [Roseibium sp. RKSG952]MTH98209.1 MFS transporter [Roseibium sp. RKSG952]